MHFWQPFWQPRGTAYRKKPFFLAQKKLCFGIIKAKKMSNLSDDIFVTRDTLLESLGLKLTDSTFFEWGHKGLLVRAVVKGYYKLNATRANLGLPLADLKEFRQQLEREHERHNQAWQRKLLFTALSILSEEALICPADDIPLRLTPKDMEVVAKHYAVHRPFLEIPPPSATISPSTAPTCLLTDPIERLHYVGSVLDAHDMSTTGRIRGATLE
ncbi:hypothetical protein H5P28_18625 [Ruficoccus amylovorans]|uniref:Uncharacterized protein n=1 Tax=Ruficoccus amylovorans TaxID=1804625 RepID=A0A842HLE4_9BACT|nr:hypothetical protein [Ruficoccus amylovorans]MBC2596287.1 hypothetical protein [Ruficoccus amylovorans]